MDHGATQPEIDTAPSRVSERHYPAAARSILPLRRTCEQIFSAHPRLTEKLRPVATKCPPCPEGLPEVFGVDRLSTQLPSPMRKTARAIYGILKTGVNVTEFGPGFRSTI
jgi:hypothetical protein